MPEDAAALAAPSTSSNSAVRPLRIQLRALRWTLPGVALAAVLGVSGAVWLAGRVGVPVSALTRDLASQVDVPYFGALSTLGTILWSVAAGLCLGGSAVLRARGGDREAVRFLLTSGLITAFLAVDDGLMIHDNLFLERYFEGAGIPGAVVYAGYGLAIFVWLAAFGSRILATDWLLLALALGAFGLSMAVDTFAHVDEATNLVEDGAKFTGIVLWLAYFARAVPAVAGHRPPPARPPRDGP